MATGKSKSSGNTRAGTGLLHYAVTIFLSSFLLFQIQPIIARYILPWFGGTPAVWTTCMVFFQSLLLLGYTYAHFVGRLSRKTQAILHISLLLVSIVFLKVEPSLDWKSTGLENPVLVILALLTVTIGVPYLLVSSTGPLIQHWFAQTNPGQSPYRLFALSNVGSLLGLLSYPFLIEPMLSLHTQALIWRIGYLAFVVLCAGCAVRLLRQSSTESTATNQTEDNAEAPAPAWTTRLLWLGLAAVASIMLLATTNHICQDVAVIPFLWILPLSLYLISFIICFDKEAWYKRSVWVPAGVVAIATIIWLMMYNLSEDSHVLILVGVFCLGMFICCMICHGEMVRLKPAPRYLTSFYLLVALGGALGGVFVSLVAPKLFTGFWELHIGIILTAILGGITLLRQPKLRNRLQWTIGWATATFILAGFLIHHVRETIASPIDTSRNFYGVLRIYQKNLEPADPEHHKRVNAVENGKYTLRSMYHGEIIHGTQFTEGLPRKFATTYYSRNSGISLAIRLHPNSKINNSATPGIRKGLKIGVVGLGTGTIAALTRKRDDIRYYEINPEVIRLNKKYFTYLSDTEATTTVVLGDGRIRLEEELAKDGSNRFDILVLDAFSGDAIPVHLITREAFELYFKHLEPDGILVVNITNKHLDLSPVLKVLAS